MTSAASAHHISQSPSTLTGLPKSLPPSTPIRQNISYSFVSSIITAANQSVMERESSSFQPPAMVATFGVGSFGNVVRPPLSHSIRMQSPSRSAGLNTNDHPEEQYLVPPYSASSTSTDVPRHQMRYNDENVPFQTPTSRTPSDESTPRTAQKVRGV